MRRIPHILLCACLVFGCGETTRPQPPTPTSLIASDGAVSTQVWSPSTSFTFLGPGPHNNLTGQRDDGTLWLLNEFEELEYDASFSTDRVLSTLIFSDQSQLISTNNDLQLYREGRRQPSPLRSAFGMHLPSSMLHHNATLWMATEQGLYHHKDNILAQVHANLGEAPYILSAGPSPDDNTPTASGLWLGSSRGIFLLETQGPELTLRPSLEGHPIQTLQTSLPQYMWALSQGSILVRTPDNATWNTLQLPEEAVWLGAHPDSKDVWIHTSDRQTYHYAEGTLTPVSMDTWSEVAWVDAHGRLLLATDSGVVAHERRYAIRHSTLPQQLSETAQVRVSYSFPEQLKQWTAKVGDVDLEVNVQNNTLTLHPQDIGSGQHTLHIIATYTGGQVAHTQAHFHINVQDPSWEKDISPLFEERCASCHGARASRELYLRDQWERDFESIYEQVESGLMPLPPFPRLNDSELERLRRWRDNGFRE